MSKRDNVFEIRELSAILKSQALDKILQKRKAFHQNKVNEYVRAQKFTAAYGSLCKLDDIDKFVDIVQAEYAKLMEEAKKKEE